MKQFLTVLKFDFKQVAKNKGFYFVLIFMSIMSLIGGLSPLIVSKLSDSKPKTDNSTKISEEASTKEKLGLIISKNVDSSFEKALENKYSIVKFDSEENLIKAINSKKVPRGLVLKSNIDSIVFKSKLFEDGSDLKTLLENNYRNKVLAKELNLDINKLQKLEQSQINFSLKDSSGSGGVSSAIRPALAYIVVFILYLSVLQNISFISSNIAKEKENRTMEMLVTTVNPLSMIFGKVVSGILMTLILVACMLTGFLIGVGITYSFNESIRTMINLLINNMQIDILSILIVIIFMLLGIFMYYLIGAALASLVTKLEQVGQAIMPVILVVIIGFIGTMINFSNPDNIFMSVLSYIPFTSPFAMTSKYILTNVSYFELLTSFGILIVTCIVFGILSAKIYRLGTLNYGNKVNLFSLLKLKKNK